MKNKKYSLKLRSTVWLVFWMLVFSTFIVLPNVMAEEGEAEGSPPVADAGGPYFSTECIEIVFDASSSWDPDGDELWCHWNFDGTWTEWSLYSNEVYVWYDDFIGTITLEVTDGHFFVTDTAEVTVENVAPTIFVSFGDYIIGDLDVELEVTVEFWDPDDRAVSDDSHLAEFDWGDETSDTYEVDTGGFFVNGYHTYSDIGEYQLSLTISDDDGGSNAIIIPVLIQGIEVGEDVTTYEGEPFIRTSMFFYEEAEVFSGVVNYGDTNSDESILSNFEDGVFDLNHIYADNGDFIVSVDLFDMENNLLGSNSLTVHVLNVAPEIISIENLPSDPVAIGSTVDLLGTFTDPGEDDTHNAAVSWGDGIDDDATVVGHTFTGSHVYSEAGVFTVAISVEDDDGGSDEEIYQYVVVYDPDSGFVTGGGWINSPEGAYKPDTTLTGKANFGFVSKYKKGKINPEGNTEFQFKTGDLNFHSNEYDWLVIAGSKAMYKGTGTINNEGNYGFMLSAIDGDLKGDDADKFRIKIWDKGTDELIYDNNLGGDDYDAPSTELAGGKIVIHKK